MENIIEIKNLKFKYEENEDYAIDGVNLNIKQGEFVAILGHNGSGKSTLARLLNALLTPTEGEVIVKGLNTKDEEVLWEIRKTCGMVFQNPDNQLVTTIVEEEVAFGPENIGIENPKLRQRVDEALEIVEMTDYRRKAPANLSGGQKQRIAIAGILAMKPDIIVMDEPTAMLDPKGRDEIIRTAKKINKQGTTIINITHYMEEAVEADRVIIMDRGKISLEGSPKEVFSNVKKVKEIGLDVPQTTEIAYLLKEKGYNLPDGILEIDELVKLL